LQRPFTARSTATGVKLLQLAKFSKNGLIKGTITATVQKKEEQWQCWEFFNFAF